jgi:hypothetical protein
MSKLVDFFRGEGADLGAVGDYNGFDPEDTAIYFMKAYINLQKIETIARIRDDAAKLLEKADALEKELKE